jgi:hypothetical protein
MEIKFEQAVVALLALQVFLTFVLIGGFNDFTEELFEEDNDSSMACDCYCDYPYYWYYDYNGVMVAEGGDPDRDGSGEDNATADNNTA